MHRRSFIKNTGCLAIGFTIGGGGFRFPAPLVQELPEGIKRYPHINAWLQVLADNRVRVFTGKIELGQGIRTAIAQVAAEELYCDMQHVEVVLVDTALTPDEGYTVGSGSIEQSAMAVRYAAAAARQKLFEMASQQSHIPVDQLSMNNGQITGAGGAVVTGFTDLLQGKQLTSEIKGPVALKPKEKYRLVGKAIPRDDIGRMVRGEPVYVQDLRFPGMVYATVVHPPAYGAKLLQIDENGLQKHIPGILKTVVDGSFVGVIAKDEYQAIRAQQWLKQHSKWSEGNALPTTGLPDHIKTLPAKTQQVHEQGKVNVDGRDVIKAQYFKPYLMHGSIGPSCAVALYNEGVLHLWSHSQGIFSLQEALAKLLNVPIDHIHITGVPGSGCYGHNGADDVAADAALLAMAYPGKHVRLQWTRDDEHAWEPYGSAMIMELSARLDASGKISDWRYDLWSDTHSTRPAGNPENLLAAHYITNAINKKPGGYAGGAIRNSEPYYAIPNQLVTSHFFDGPLRVSALRSLGAYANVFAIESFMDELAEKAGKDVFAFRLQHLTDDRAKATLVTLQQMVVNEPLAAQTGIGVAFSRYKNSASYCAVAAKVHAPAGGKVQVQKMWAVIDAGEAINIDGLKNQTEGGLIQSASWTLMEQVRFDAQHITSRDWFSYPIFRFSQVPEVEVVVLNHPEEKAMGAGEAAQGPAAAAIVNAIYKASGKRIRHLPVQ